MVKIVCTLLVLVWGGMFVENGFVFTQADTLVLPDSVELMPVENLEQLDSEDEASSDLELFFGRFHPIFVHLPIGFLLFAFLLECASMIKRYESLSQAVPFALLMGGISGITAGLTGYLLSGSGGYGEDLLTTHQWLGIGVIVLSFVTFLLRIYLYDRKRDRILFRIVLVVLVLMVMGTGHYGGSLTHGPDYMFRYMPEPMRSWINVEAIEEEDQIELIEDLDEALVYEHVIAPIVRTRCQSCHNPDRREGELLMTSYDQLMAGGESGPAIVEHQPEDSELYTRLLLPERDDKRMPPRGRRQLTTNQIKLIRWWIEQGAPSSVRVTEVNAEGEISDILQSLTVEGQDFYERVQVPAAEEELVQNLRNEGFLISSIAVDIPFLQVSLPKSKTSLRGEELDKLLPISQQITWLDLGRIEVSDNDLKRLSDFTHLTKLSLQQTSVTDSTLAAIGSLEHLEYLNLYGTDVTDQGLEHLQSLSSLKSLYLWQTNVTAEGIDELKTRQTGVNVDFGINSNN